ncbi:mechanosensitive ion channel family protein [Sanyastnella coralliicola]|uniref:mechanosensitive ion channel family protein n=1 Tax=Sanyastnella coralliicola TaxID=3069118 RepID=UPI0027BA9DCB|nr:mechanosensitive ion channel domain-containing protein [Longitalea sp. SCSIO 12813]
METLDRIKEALMNSFASFGEGIADYVPIVISALVVLLVGWIISKLFAGLIHKGLKSIKFDALIEKIGLDKMLSKIKKDLSGAYVLSRIFYWILMLLFITSAANVLGWQMLTDGIAAFMGYLPTLGISLIIFIIGVYVAELIKTMVYTAANSIGISGAKTIANIVYYLLFIFIAITALNQAGIDTDIITSNLTIILASVLLAFALSYGIASRHIVTNMLSSFYSKGKFREGQRIRMGEVEGTILTIDSVSVTIETADGNMVVPSKQLIEEQVLILEKPNEE